MRATPRRDLGDLGFVCGRKQLQRLREVHQLHVATLGEPADRCGERLVAALAMVAERLAVDRDHQRLVATA